MPPLFHLSIVSILFAYLSWIPLPALDSREYRQWIYRFLENPIKVSCIAEICWSPIFHLTEWMSSSSSFHISKRCVMKLSVLENTHSSKRMHIILRICISNNSKSMWDFLIQSAYFKSHLYLLHVLNLCFLVIMFPGMNYLMLEFFLKLEILLFETIKIVVEVKWLRHLLILVCRLFVNCIF